MMEPQPSTSRDKSTDFTSPKKKRPKVTSFTVNEKIWLLIPTNMLKKLGLRLPPYHCELNPIELIWADVKGHVARNNTTFKFEKVKALLSDGMAKVTPDRWKKCVEHIQKEEDKFFKLDFIVDDVTDKFIIRVTDSDSDSTDSEESASD